MQLLTKRYGNDPMKTYRVLMRKLNKEGHYQEIKEKQFFKSKSQKKREDKVRGTVRVKRKLKAIEESLNRAAQNKKPIKVPAQSKRN